MNKIIFLAMLFCSSLSLAGNLICAGDSQTSIRTPLVASDTYCHKMAIATGKTAINAGVGGNTSADLLARINTDVLTQPGTCVVVMIGANDAFIDNSATYDYSSYWAAPKKSAVSVSQYITNLSSIVQQILKAGKEVTLITPWAFFSTPQLNQFPFYVDAMKAVGKQKNVPVMDAYDIQLNRWWSSAPWMATGSPSLWDLEQDYQHPSAAGHTAIKDLCAKPQNIDACACKR